VFCGGHFELLIRGLVVPGTEITEVTLLLTEENFLRAPSRLGAISVISVPDLALGDRANLKFNMAAKT